MLTRKIARESLGWLAALLLPFALLSVGLPAKAADNVQYPLTLKFSTDGTVTERTFNAPTDKLPGQSSGGFSEPFSLGWSTSPITQPTAVDPNTYYRAGVDTVGTLVDHLDTVDENTTLYAVSAELEDLFGMLAGLSGNGGKYYIGLDQEPQDVIENASLRSSEGFADATATRREIVTRYEQGREQYGLKFTTSFTYADSRVPMVVAANPLGGINRAEGVTDFSGVTPKSEYSHEDLTVTLYPKLVTATNQTGWSFSSSTFKVAAVLDGEGNTLPMTLGQSNDPLVQNFSFENPNKATTFIIRTIPRSDIAQFTGAQLLAPMQLSFDSFENVAIPQAYAKELVDSAGTSVTTGLIQGSARIQVFILDRSFPIGPDTTENDMAFSFVAPVVQFDKNSVALSDTAAQNLGYSRVAIDGSFKENDFAGDTQPTQAFDTPGNAFLNTYEVGKSYEINGKSYVFVGWNTKQDGTGNKVADATTITADMLAPAPVAADAPDLVLYAQWAHKVTYEFEKAADVATELPQGIIDMTPKDDLGPDELGYQDGDEVTPTDEFVAGTTTYTDPDTNTVWVFQGWQPERATIEGADVTFVGTWAPDDTAVAALKIVKAFDNGDAGLDLAGLDPAPTFSGTYTCTDENDDTKTVAAGTWTVNGAGEATLTPAEGNPAADEIPAGASCEAVETKVVTAATEGADAQEADVAEATLGLPLGYAWNAPTVSEAVTITAGAADAEGAGGAEGAEDAEPATITVTNSVKQLAGAVTWTKTDTAQAPLKGSEWKLTGPEGFTALTNIADCAPADAAQACTATDTNPAPGVFTVENLPWGEYTLVETRAPAGYKLDATEHKFTVSADEFKKAKSLTITAGAFENELQDAVVLPLTGGVGTDSFILAGAGMLAGALGLGVWLHRRHTRTARA